VTPSLAALAPAKVNLTLRILGRRADGYHELDSLVVFAGCGDHLTFEAGPSLDLTVSGPTAGQAGAVADNLVLRAAKALADKVPGLTVGRFALTKELPAGAGLGGGSADAAAALRLASAVTEPIHPPPNLRPEELDLVAASLGSDVPSQLVSGVAVGTGAGDLAERFEPLATHAYVVLPTDLRLSTATVYAEADRLGLGRPEGELRDLHAALIAALEPAMGGARIPERLLVNDLQEAALSLCPEIGARLETLLSVGAEQVLVSGSGPSTVGIRWGEGALQWASGAADRLRATHPGAVAARPVNAEFAMPELA
jgi:4-diphosphocytidyl-2-C-methyl-D-erythritol kinase